MQFLGQRKVRSMQWLVCSQPLPSAAPLTDQHLRMAKAIVIGMKDATAAEKEEFASHKKVKILLACGLHTFREKSSH